MTYCFLNWDVHVILSRLFVFCCFFFSEEPIQKLIQAAIAAKEHAYCPYSNFRVGSSVLCEDGSIFSGK